MWEEKSLYDAYNEFYKSEEPHSFRMQSLQYDEKKKFKKFIEERIEAVK